MALEKILPPPVLFKPAPPLPSLHPADLPLSWEYQKLTLPYGAGYSGAGPSGTGTGTGHSGTGLSSTGHSGNGHSGNGHPGTGRAGYFGTSSLSELRRDFGHAPYPPPPDPSHPPVLVLEAPALGRRRHDLSASPLADEDDDDARPKKRTRRLRKNI